MLVPPIILAPQSTETFLSPLLSPLRSFLGCTSHVGDVLCHLHYLFQKSPYDAIEELMLMPRSNYYLSPHVRLIWTDPGFSNPGLPSVLLRSLRPEFSHFCIDAPTDDFLHYRIPLNDDGAVKLKDVAEQMHLQGARLRIFLPQGCAPIRIINGTITPEKMVEIAEKGAILTLNESVSPGLVTVRAIRQLILMLGREVVPEVLTFLRDVSAEIINFFGSHRATSLAILLSGLLNSASALSTSTSSRALFGVAWTAAQYIGALRLQRHLRRSRRYGKVVKAFLYTAIFAWIMHDAHFPYADLIPIEYDAAGEVLDVVFEMGYRNLRFVSGPCAVI